MRFAPVSWLSELAPSPHQANTGLDGDPGGGGLPTVIDRSGRSPTSLTVARQRGILTRFPVFISGDEDARTKVVREQSEIPRPGIYRRQPPVSNGIRRPPDLLRAGDISFRILAGAIEGGLHLRVVRIEVLGIRRNVDHPADAQ